MGEIWILAIHKRGCGRPQVSEILCHLKRFSGPGMSWLLWCEWVTHSWHGFLSSDSSHCGTWACLLMWGPAHTKISLNLRASAGQEERGLVTRGAHLLHCPGGPLSSQGTRLKITLQNWEQMCAGPLWPPSTSPFTMTCLQKIFLKYSYSNKTYFINCFLFMTRWTGVVCFSILCPEGKLAEK